MNTSALKMAIEEANDVEIALKRELDARDAELAQLRARLAALEPLAQAAVDYYIGWKAGGGESGRAEFLNQGRAYARAQAQDGAA